MVSSPKVCVLVLNWNGWQDTIECLRSLLESDYPNMEIVVLDNGSTDDSIERIKNWFEETFSIACVICDRKALKGIDFRNHDLMIVDIGENLGYAGGNNVGIEYALSRDDVKYIWILNNDTVVAGDALSLMIKLAESGDKIGLVGAKVLFYDSPDVIQCLGGTDYIRWNGFGKPIARGEKEEKFTDSFEIKGYVYGACLLLKKEVLENIGMFDEAYFLQTEETDLCFRAKQCGWKQVCCSRAKIWHKEGKATGKEDEGSLRYYVIGRYYNRRNYIYFLKKHLRNYLKHGIINLLLSSLKVFKHAMICPSHFQDTLIEFFFSIWGLFDGLRGNMGKTLDPAEFDNKNGGEGKTKKMEDLWEAIEEFREQFNRLVSAQKVAIFGASSGGKKALAFLKKLRKKVVCFFDNDPSKWGKRVGGIEVLSPSSIEGIAPDLIVVASSTGEGEIVTQLTEGGYEDKVMIIGFLELILWSKELFELFREIYDYVRELNAQA
ncbi:MAG: glycosyltransferase [Synergistetes bacterium]|nr:glycosyltransferase [Synergistota bacterium]